MNNSNDGNFDRKKFCLNNNQNDLNFIDSKMIKIPKHKVSILLGYSGKGFSGMQLNQGVDTIEQRILTALKVTELVKAVNADSLKKVGFQRTARTDKGVSAIGQIISLKVHYRSEIIDLMNNNLPPSIRCFKCILTPKSFNAKNNCDSRTYTYTLPSLIFNPNIIFDDNNILNEKEYFKKIGEAELKYRISEEDVSKLCSTLKLYEGSHHFHNYTSKKVLGDPSNVRYIMKFDLDSKKVIYNDMEFLRLRIKGQSFLLNQIRKIVAMVILVMRGSVNDEYIRKSFDKTLKQNLPIAPALGLVLESVSFDSYLKHCSLKGVKANFDFSDVSDEQKLFAERNIYNDIYSREFDEMGMIDWLYLMKKRKQSKDGDDFNNDGDDFNNDGE